MHLQDTHKKSKKDVLRLVAYNQIVQKLATFRVPPSDLKLATEDELTDARLQLDRIDITDDKHQRSITDVAKCCSSAAET